MCMLGSPCSCCPFFKNKNPSIHVLIECVSCEGTQWPAMFVCTNGCYRSRSRVVTKADKGTIYGLPICSCNPETTVGVKKEVSVHLNNSE